MIGKDEAGLIGHAADRALTRAEIPRAVCMANPSLTRSALAGDTVAKKQLVMAVKRRLDRRHKLVAGPRSQEYRAPGIIFATAVGELHRYFANLSGVERLALLVTEGTCAHLPALSEPTLTLHCTCCGTWLRATGDRLEEVGRRDATRGTHRCPRCKAEWTGDEDWCEECELPTWAP